MLDPRGAKGRQDMPVSQGVDEMIHFGAGFDNPFTEMAQHPLLNNGLVKVSPGNADSTSGEDFTLAAVTQPHNRDVEGTTAEVEDQNILRPIQGGFVI